MWLDSILGLFAPSFCKGCNKASSAGLCPSCFDEIMDEPYAHCLICNNLTTVNNLCKSCRSSSGFYSAYVIGKNEGVIKELVYDYKLLPERALAKTLANLLDKALPLLPNDTIVTSIPTIPNHIRQRGFGHTELIAHKFARKRHLPYRQLLTRSDNTIMHGLKARERRKAASRAFVVKKNIGSITNVLLIDDIYTTGSTANAAAKLLKNAGIKNINLAIIARHSGKVKKQ